MRKFIILSLMAIMGCTDLLACGGDYGNHNNYLFSVFRREMMNEDLFKDRADAFWKEYTSGAADSYQWNKNLIRDVIDKKGDTEMARYTEWLNTYLEICSQLKDTWNYPTKEELQERKTTLLNMLKAAREYKGTRLQAQYALLRMRTNMVLGSHMDNVSFWEQTGQKMAPSVYRNMMENIYAGALLHLNQRTKACEIYARQEDMVSIKWAMRKYRNLAGIKTIMAENPNSMTMNFLVQDFVNNAQETQDTEEEFLADIDARPIKTPEVLQFISYAQEVVDKKLSHSPALWLAAIGELQWLLGQDDKAMATLDKAVKADGTPRMKDNARAIRMVVSVRPSKMDKKYASWLAGELKWLNGKIKEEAGNEANRDNYHYPFYDNHYFDVLDRLVFANLHPKYEKMGNKSAAAATLCMMQNSDKYLGINFSEPSGWNPNYSSEYFIYLDDKMSTQDIVNLQQWANKAPANDLEQLLKPFCKDNNFLNDLIGTRYMADADFSTAIGYLEKVPTSFLNKQNISWYMGHRDYTTARWLKRQADDEREETDGPDLANLTSNPKLNFCRELLDLESQIGTANAETRSRLAYDLATRYYQASYAGECWWLTQYGSSVDDTARVDRADLVQRAVDYLQQAKESKDFNIRQNSLYALAFVPSEPWANFDYDWQAQRDIITPHPNSRQYKALAALDAFERENRSRVAPYVSRCDVLRQFRKNR